MLCRKSNHVKKKTFNNKPPAKCNGLKVSTVPLLLFHKDPFSASTFKKVNDILTEFAKLHSHLMMVLLSCGMRGTESSYRTLL